MRTLKGIVTSVKMDKTAVISIQTYKTHQKYKKRYKVSKKFYAHDENNLCKENDKVTIKEISPMSKLKRWEVMGNETV